MKRWKQFVREVSSVPHLFSKLIVTYCIVFTSGAAVWSLRILSRTGYDAAALLGVIVGFFGGELLLLCLKTILRNNKEDNHEHRSDPFD